MRLFKPTENPHPGQFKTAAPLRLPTVRRAETVDRWNPAHARYRRAPLRGHSRTLAQPTHSSLHNPHSRDLIECDTRINGWAYEDARCVGLASPRRGRAKRRSSKGCCRARCRWRRRTLEQDRPRTGCAVRHALSPSERLSRQAEAGDAARLRQDLPARSWGISAIPGRFYPTTRALCFSWNQRVAPSSCGRLGLPIHLLATSRGLARFQGQSTVLTALRPGRTVNLFAALQLAFDRYRASRPANPPERCRSFVAGWAGPRAAQRPSRICVFRHGVYARGRIYPAGRAMWRLALDAS